MSRGEILLQFGFYTAPAIAVFGAVYFFTSKWFEIQKDKLKLRSIEQNTPVLQEKKSDINKHILPMQVDAYQRMVLFLERIAPNNMVMRLNNPGLPAGAFQAKLLDTIRQEYEHNLAQQIFVSPDAWEITKNSKEEVLKRILIVVCALVISFSSFAGGGGGGGGGGSSSAVPAFNPILMFLLIAVVLYCFRKEK